MEQPPVQIGQYVLGKNLGIGAFGKVSEVVRCTSGRFLVHQRLRCQRRGYLDSVLAKVMIFS